MFVRVPCTSPAMGLSCTPECRCGYCDDEGMCDEPDFTMPWCDFSVGSDLRALVGLPADGEGTVPADQVPAVLRRILRALNVEADRAHLVEEGYEGPALATPRVTTDPETGLATLSRGCHVISGGCTDEMTVRRLVSLQKLFTYAADNGYTVRWY
jgi:hypothetical protein